MTSRIVVITPCNSVVVLDFMFISKIEQTDKILINLKLAAIDVDF